MKKIFLNSFYILVSFVAFAGCMTASKNKNIEKPEGKFESISIGDEEKKLASLFGSGESSFEVYPDTQYRVVSYNKSNGQPDVFFTIDQKSNEVVGKSKWMDQYDKMPNLETFLISEFKGIQFKTYTPCRTRSENDKILVNPEAGVYLATENNRVVLVSYATKDLLDLRVNLIQKNCSNIQ